MCNQHSIFEMHRKCGQRIVDFIREPLYFSLICNLVPYKLTQILALNFATAIGKGAALVEKTAARGESESD